MTADLHPAPATDHPVERLLPPVRRVWAGVWHLARRNPLALLFGGLLATDLALVAIQVAVDATSYGFTGAYRLSLETEHGLAQAFGWLQEGATAGLLFYAWRRFKNPSAGFWAAALVYVTLDDALTLHERLGGYLSDVLGLGGVGPLRSQDLGEAIVYMIAIAGAVGLFITAEHRSPASAVTTLSRLMLPIAAAFLFFSVALDLAGAVPIAVEDGGELITLTVFFVVAAVWARRADSLAALCEPPSEAVYR